MGRGRRGDRQRRDPDADPYGPAGDAAFQVAAAGTDAQQVQARKILADSRKSVYQILADSKDEARAQEK